MRVTTGRPVATEEVWFSDAKNRFLENSRVKNRDSPRTYERHKTSRASLGHYFGKERIKAINAGLRTLNLAAESKLGLALDFEGSAYAEQGR